MTDKLGDYGRTEGVWPLLGTIQIEPQDMPKFMVIPPIPPPVPPRPRRPSTPPVFDPPADLRMYPPQPPDPHQPQNAFPDGPVSPIIRNPHEPKEPVRAPAIEVDSLESNPLNGLPQDFEPPVPRDNRHRVITMLYPWSTAALGSGGWRQDSRGLSQLPRIWPIVSEEAWTLANIDRGPCRN